MIGVGIGAGFADLDGREGDAVRRLVDRVAHGCDAATIAFEPPAARGVAGPERVDVLAFHHVGTSRAGIADLASRAAKVLVVVQANPDRLAVDCAGTRDTVDLARMLWELGRVREHAYLVFPRAVEVFGAAKGQVVAPDVAYAPVGALLRRTARLHAYVVDTTPRSRQARRKLRVADASREPA